MIRLGILGTAQIARALFRHPLDGVEIVAIGSRDGRRARRFARAHGIPRAYGSYAALLADRAVDAVYIPLPHHLHAEYAILAVEAGKHVLLEKPAAMNARELRGILRACRRRDVLFMEALMYRFLRVHVRAREILQEGTIGDLRYIDYNLSFDAATRGTAGFRLVREQGGGALYNLGVYGVDFIRFVSGRDPRLVHSVMRRAGGIDVFTHALYRIGPAVAAVTIGFNCDANFYTVSGSRGAVHNPVALSGREEPQMLSVHLHDGNRRYEEHFAPDTPYKREVEYFARCIERNEEPFLGGENSLKNVKLLDELFRRSRRLPGRTAGRRQVRFASRHSS